MATRDEEEIENLVNKLSWKILPYWRKIGKP